MHLVEVLVNAGCSDAGVSGLLKRAALQDSQGFCLVGRQVGQVQVIQAEVALEDGTFLHRQPVDVFDGHVALEGMQSNKNRLNQSGRVSERLELGE